MGVLLIMICFIRYTVKCTLMVCFIGYNVGCTPMMICFYQVHCWVYSDGLFYQVHCWAYSEYGLFYQVHCGCTLMVHFIGYTDGLFFQVHYGMYSDDDLFDFLIVLCAQAALRVLHFYTVMMCLGCYPSLTPFCTQCEE